MTDRSDLTAWVADFAKASSTEEAVETFVAYVDGAILARIPEIAADPVLTTELHASTGSQFKTFVHLLDRARQEVLLPPPAADLARSIARRGLDLGILLKVYRVANDQVWEYFTAITDEIPADGPDRTEVLKFLWGRGGRWINDAIEQLILVYLAERDAVLHGALARRTETVQALLRGDPVPVDTASRHLGHQLRAQQTGMVLWVDASLSEASLAPLDTVARAIAAALGAPHPLTLPVGSRELWLWLGTRREPDLDGLEAVLAEHSDRAPGTRLAVGCTAPGVEGFRTSHREAVDAQRCAVSGAAGRSTPPVTLYADVELVCLVADQPEAMAVLVARELGRLAEPDPALDKVRETVGFYLRSGCNVEATAAQLTIHKNTVRYRLAQAEELLGHPLTQRRTEIDLALRHLAHVAPLAPLAYAAQPGRAGVRGPGASP